MAALSGQPSGANADSEEFSLLGSLVTQAGGALTVLLHGELDLATSPALARQMVALLALPVGSITLDLGAVEFMDSSGLNALRTIHRAAEERGVSLSLAELPDQVRQVLDLTRMAETFQYVS